MAKPARALHRRSCRPPRRPGGAGRWCISLADVHTGAESNGLQAFENLDGTCVVVALFLVIRGLSIDGPSVEIRLVVIRVFGAREVALIFGRQEPKTSTRPGHPQRIKGLCRRGFRPCLDPSLKAVFGPRIRAPKARDSRRRTDLDPVAIEAPWASFLEATSAGRGPDIRAVDAAGCNTFGQRNRDTCLGDHDAIICGARVGAPARLMAKR